MLLPSQQWDALMEGLVKGDYQVILGAGASRGAHNRYGALPDAKSLCDQLCSEFRLPAPPPDATLAEVYEMAARRSPEAIGTFMKRRFIEAVAPSWYQDFVSIPWRYIWTLNVDDVLDDAYIRRFAECRRQRLVSRSWVDDHYVSRRPAEEVLAVYLHGKAERAEDNPGELVFDMRTYLNAVQQGHRWHKIFSDEYRNSPVIVLGARLQFEPDLHSALTAKIYKEGDAPSVLILPGELTDWQLEEYTSRGLIHIRATAERFLEEVRKDFNRYARKYQEAEDLVGPLAHSFLQQWQEIDFTQEVKKDAFFEGHDPLAADIVANLDGRRDLADELLTLVRQAAEQEEPIVLCLYGAPFSGKTTTSLRVLYEVNRDTGAKVYEFKGLARIDMQAAAQWVRKSPNTVLYLDGLADFREDISNLVERCRTLQVPVRVIAAERENRMHSVRSAIRSDLQSALLPLRISRKEATEIVEIREVENRLGNLTGKSWPDRYDFIFREHKGELFAALSGIEEYAGQGFIQRVVTRYEALRKDERRLLFLVTCVSAALGYRLPVGLALSASSMSDVTFKNALEGDDDLAYILEYRGGRLMPRHRVFASHLLERLDRKSKWEATQALARALSPHVSRPAIAQRTLEYRIVKELMDKDVLRGWLGSDQLDSWYEQLESDDLFGWNARFWEQRALSASELGNHSRALHYAYKAYACRSDAYTMNTLATIKMRRAIDEVPLDYAGASNIYYEAIEILEECRKEAREDSEYPYITFFSYTLRYARALKSNGFDVEAGIRRHWDLWMSHSRNSEAFNYVNGFDQLNRYHRDWLQLNIT